MKTNQEVFNELMDESDSCIQQAEATDNYTLKFTLIIKSMTLARSALKLLDCKAHDSKDICQS